MSNQQVADREKARTGTQSQDKSGQRSGAADGSEDHLIRGYN